jgi:hypothetical protein
MNEVYKSKSVVRAETEKQVAEFLARGGVIEVIKARKAPKQKMKAKSTRSVGGSGSLGFRTSSFGV